MQFLVNDASIYGGYAYFDTSEEDFLDTTIRVDYRDKFITCFVLFGKTVGLGEYIESLLLPYGYAVGSGMHTRGVLDQYHASENF